MNKSKIKDWKETVVEAYCQTERKNGKVQWGKIVEKVEKVHKNIFKDCKNPKKKLQDLFRSANIKKMVAAYEAAAITTEEAEPSVEKKEERRATTAHVYDEDSNEETESEVVVTETLEEKRNKDGSRSKTVDILTLEDATNMTDEKIMRILGYDPERFKLVSSSCRRGTWQAQTKDDGGVIDLCSFRLNANVRPLAPGEINMETVQKTLREIVDEKEKLLTTSTTTTPEGDKIAILSIADLHLGKLAWAPECGESYDHKIAVKRFNHIVNSGIERIKKEDGIEKIVFFWSQDFFHFDTIAVTTTAGTRQDTDVRWQKMWDYGTKMLVEAIEKLKAIAPVETFYVRSNHDTQTSYYAASLLDARFYNDPLVTIDTGASPRKYLQYGTNLFGFGHGDKEGKRISSMMPVEKPVAWGQTRNHEFFLGHYHSLRTYEENGVILRYLSSPTGTDAWHCEEGFLGAQKAAQLFIRGKHIGQIAEYTIHVE